MKQHLVLWGDIGTDRKALIAIYLQEAKNKVHIYAFPREQVSKELQEKLFEWSSGGEYEFPEDALHWEISASQDNILPPEIKVDKPEMVTRTQAEWGRMIMSARLYEVLKEEAGLLQQKAESLTDYSQELWDSAKELWGKISEYRKKNELSWEQSDQLKNTINMVFDGLKAVRRIDHEKDDETTTHNFNSLTKKINDAVARLIYPEEWGKLFDVFKLIQEEVKKFQLKTGQRRQLFDRLNEAFDDLRKYRKAEFVNRNKSRIAHLESTVKSITQSIQREKDNYQEQFDKMMHYTRGKLSAEQVGERLTHIKDRLKEKEDKIAAIQKTIRSIQEQMARDEKSEPRKDKKKDKEKKEKGAGEKKEDKPAVPDEPAEEIVLPAEAEPVPAPEPEVEAAEEPVAAPDTPEAETQEEVVPEEDIADLPDEPGEEEQPA